MRPMGLELIGSVPWGPGDRPLTACTMVEDRAKALIAGYQCHLAKPVEPWELVANLASLWDLEARRRQGSGT